MDTPSHSRIPGIELARGLAIIGMLSVHIGPTRMNTLAERVYSLPSGRASILFVLVAGLGVSLLACARGMTPLDARLRLVWRALLLLPLGLALQELDTTVRVILPTYALLFVLGIGALGLRDRSLLLLAGGFGLLGPVVFLLGEIHAPMLFIRDPASFSDSIGEIAHKLLFSGSYPLITWAAPFLLGIWLGRQDLHSQRLRLALIVAGAAAALVAAGLSGLLGALYGDGYPVGWARLMLDAAHSQMPLWLLGATGAAVMLLGLSLVAADSLGRLVWPLVALGQLSLTVYVGHLLALHWWADTVTSERVSAAAVILLTLIVTAAAMAMAWRRLFARGPLESLLHLPWQVYRQIFRQLAKRRPPTSA